MGVTQLTNWFHRSNVVRSDRASSHGRSRMASGAVPPSSEDVHDQLRKAFQRRIPSGNKIAADAVHKAIAGREGDDAWIRQNFSNLVEHVQIGAFESYLAAEQIA